jgi:hypothetical protein
MVSQSVHERQATDHENNLLTANSFLANLLISIFLGAHFSTLPLAMAVYIKAMPWTSKQPG